MLMYFILLCINLQYVCALLLHISAYSVCKRVTYTHGCALYIIIMYVDVSDKMIIAHIIYLF